MSVTWEAPSKCRLLLLLLLLNSSAILNSVPHTSAHTRPARNTISSLPLLKRSCCFLREATPPVLPLPAVTTP